ncbi:hypothetical protein GO986_12170 [Deinococcus sp. HMF7620]|uniref:Uncharacterized protein n=1 Tax=Deinococcus arboris TaxID=2682977 RepID=A0A7C9LRN8_9DEIO|nr:MULTISPECIES: hypothetical protein [Deinococcus]MBZ9752127.1 hypothetical protein [Deinococcus betulae]MVN87521.1 hypothetical protein [Deinococcus arboris]
MRLHAAPAHLQLGGTSHLRELGALCLEGGVPVKRPPTPQDTPDAYIRAEILPEVHALKLPLSLGLLRHDGGLAAYVMADDSKGPETVRLAGAVQRWGAPFLAGVLPHLHRVARPVFPLLSPLTAGDQLLGMYGNVSAPAEHPEIVEGLADWHGLAFTTLDDTQTLLEGAGKPTPRALLREFGPFLGHTVALRDLADQARALDHAAVALIRDLMEGDTLLGRWPLITPDHWPDLLHAPCSVDGEDPVAALLDPAATPTDVSWCAHALHEWQDQTNECGTRPLHAWDLTEPDHRASALAFLRVAPGLTRHVRRALRTLHHVY